MSEIAKNLTLALVQYALNEKRKMQDRTLTIKANRGLCEAKHLIYEKTAERKAYKAALERTEKMKAMRRAYKEANPRTDYNRKYEAAYHARRKALHDEKQATDVQYRLRRALRARLKQAIKKNAIGGSAVRDLGCAIGSLRAYLEAQFETGMTWKNFGRLSADGSTWQIDHFHPLSSFDLVDDHQRRLACHYSNLRPLWALDNRRKGNKIVGRQEVSCAQ